MDGAGWRLPTWALAMFSRRSSVYCASVDMELAFALLFLKFGLTIPWGIYLAFSSAMIVLAFIDLDHRILPDVITLNGIWLGIVISAYFAEPSPLVVRLLRAVGIDG